MDAAAEKPRRNIRQLQAFKFVRDTGKVTPAGWKPSEKGKAPEDFIVITSVS